MTEALKILILEDSPYDAEEIMRRLELSAKFECGFRLAGQRYPIARSIAGTPSAESPASPATLLREPAPEGALR